MCCTKSHDTDKTSSTPRLEGGSSAPGVGTLPSRLEAVQDCGCTGRYTWGSQPMAGLRTGRGRRGIAPPSGSWSPVQVDDRAACTSAALVEARGGVLRL